MDKIMDPQLRSAISIPSTLLYEKINCAMGGDHLNYVAKSRYHRFHIVCRYIVCLALVVTVTAIIVKLAMNT